MADRIFVESSGHARRGRDRQRYVYFRVRQGIAENFKVEQNRECCTSYRRENGGTVYKPATRKKLGKDINYSQGPASPCARRALGDLAAILPVGL